MSNTTPTQPQMEELTQAIAMLFPAITRLEDTLRSMDKEALARQQHMAEALDRIATALAALPKQQEKLLLALAEQKRATTTMETAMQSLNQRLSSEAEERAVLTATMHEMIRLLNGPA
ncbi:MAG: hypothetical protein ACXIUW_01415 [Roseinatronobacter sp.]